MSPKQRELKKRIAELREQVSSYKSQIACAQSCSYIEGCPVLRTRVEHKEVRSHCKDPSESQAASRLKTTLKKPIVGRTTNERNGDGFDSCSAPCHCTRCDCKRQYEEEHNSLAVAQEIAPIGVVSNDLRTGKSIWSNQIYAITGYGKGDLEPSFTTALNLIHPNYRPAFRRAYEDSIRCGKPYHLITKIVRKDQSIGTVEIKTRVLKDSEGRPEKLVGAVQDVTEHFEPQQKNQQFRNSIRLAERRASLGTMAATLSHTLTQPLTAINFAALNIADELETSKPDIQYISKCIDTTVTSSKKISSKIKHFRTLGKQNNQAEVVSNHLYDVATGVVELLKLQCWRTGLTIEFESLKKVPPVYAPKDELSQIFFAICENSAHASQDCNKDTLLTITAKHCEQYVEIEFTDNCGGISPEHQNIATEPFFTTKGEKGTGLGLFSVRTIAEACGGGLRICSVGDETQIKVRLCNSEGRHPHAD